MPSIMCKHFFPEILRHLNKVNKVPWMFSSTLLFFPLFFYGLHSQNFNKHLKRENSSSRDRNMLKKGELNLYLLPILPSVHSSKRVTWMSVYKQNCKMKWVLKSRKRSCLVFTQYQKAKSKFALEEKSGKEKDTGRDSSSWIQVFF